MDACVAYIKFIMVFKGLAIVMLTIIIIITIIQDFLSTRCDIY